MPPDNITPQKIKEYFELLDQYKKTEENVRKKYGSDFNDGLSERAVVGRKMIIDAKGRIEKGKDGSVPVYGNPLNQNTCAAGVCTVAADAGVDFSKMVGNLQSGLATDSKGRKIAQYNPLIRDQISRAGYREIGPDETPEPGDMAQYYTPDENSSVGAMTPVHLELVTGKGNEKDVFKTFNNYGLFNQGEGSAEVKFVKKGSKDKESGNMRASQSTRFYRLTDDESKKITGKYEINEDLESARSMSEQMQTILNSDLIPGESRDVLGSIIAGKKLGYSAEKIKKNAMLLSKNKEATGKIVDSIFAN